MSSFGQFLTCKWQFSGGLDLDPPNMRLWAFDGAEKNTESVRYFYFISYKILTKCLSSQSIKHSKHTLDIGKKNFLDTGMRNIMCSNLKAECRTAWLESGRHTNKQTYFRTYVVYLKIVSIFEQFYRQYVYIFVGHFDSRTKVHPRTTLNLWLSQLFFLH